MKAEGIKWFATATTVTEAKAAEDAVVIIAQEWRQADIAAPLMQRRQKGV
jgi:hypothetical protein